MSVDSDLPLTPADVADIVALLDGGSYTELEISTSRLTLRVARASTGGWTQEWRHKDLTFGGSAASATIEEPDSSEADQPGFGAVRAPLPGTFYRAPQPGAPAFIEAGATVTPDTIIGIIETMKVMNSVTAGVAGVVAEILATNGEAIKQDRILLLVKLPD